MLFLILAVLWTLQPHQLLGYNVDDRNPKIFTVNESASGRSYFGYSLAVYTSGKDSVLLVGAPRANSSFLPGVFEPGAVYRCSSDSGSCNEWLVDDSTAGQKPSGLSNSDRQQVRDGSWLGASMELHLRQDGSEARVAVCAPRWKTEMHTFLSTRSFMNGMCFSRGVSSSGGGSIRRYFPLSKRESQIVQINGNNYYNHGMGEAGFSLHWPASSRLRFAVGAPGAAIWTGSSLLLSELQQLQSESFDALIPDVLHDARFARNDYFGYSMTSGHFHEPGRLEYASGAPRSAETRGKVFIYQFPASTGKARLLQLKRTLEGEQYGEYFGAALAACDVNSDGRDDLMIGAPLWSKLSDEGRVYAHVSKGSEGSFERQRITAGELEQVGARFGSALGCLGDLDHDGYADLAVAAPYEDDRRGALYIFQGRREGLAERHSQRISAAELGPNLRGLGQSIARDLEGNIAVGAYLSGHVVLLASRPVLELALKLRISDEKFSLWTNQTQLPLELCSGFGGLDAPTTIGATFTVQVDKFHHRAIIYDKVAFGDTYRFTETLSKGRTRCTAIKTIYLKKNLQNVMEPIEVRAQVNLTDSSCPKCPLVNPKLSKSVAELKLAFLLDCGEDAVCDSDLRVLNVTSSDLANERRRFVVGSKPSVNVSIAIENSGEPAYRAQAHVSVPQPIAFARMPPECDEQTQVKNKALELVCNIGNPLRDNYTLLLELDMSAVVYTNETQEIQVLLTTQSEERSSLDNTGTYLINYEVDADIAIVGKSYEESESSFDHVYEIQKFGSTPIEEACVNINVPTHWHGNEIARIRHVQGYMQEGPKVKCKNIAKKDSTLFPLFHEANNNSLAGFSEARTFYVNCSNQDEVTCQTFFCPLGPFTKKSSVAKLTVTIDLRVSNSTAEAMKGKDILLFASEAFVKITMPNITFDSTNKKPDFKRISTTFFSRQTKQIAVVPLWIIVSSLLLGILLTTLLTVLLIKLGFFNRKIKDDLDALKSTEELNHGTEDNEKI